MRKVQISLLAILFCSLMSGALTIELKLKAEYGYYETYDLYVSGIIGEGHPSPDSSCKMNFLINMGPFCGTDICSSLAAIAKCGPILKVTEDRYKKFYYEQVLDLSGITFKADYYQLCNGYPILNFCSLNSDQLSPTLPAQINPKNSDFYLNFIPDFQLMRSENTKSTVQIGDPNLSILKPNTQFLRFNNAPKQQYGLWYLNVKNISFFGKTVEPDKYDTFKVYTYNLLGLSDGFDPFMASIKENGVDYHKQPDELYLYISAVDFDKLPNITYHVSDYDGVIRDLIIPPKHYTTPIGGGRLKLQVSDSPVLGYPFLYSYYTGYSMKDEIVYIGERADISASTPSFRKQEY